MKEAKPRDLAQDDFEPFRLAEIRKAIRTLATKKAAGSDGAPSEIYKNLPALVDPLATLFNGILSSGNFPLSMRTLYIRPLDKKDSD